MDQQDQLHRGRSPSAGHQQQPHIRQAHSTSPAPFPASNEPAIGLGLGLDPSTAQQGLPGASPSNNTDFAPFNDGSNFLNAAHQPAQSFDQSTLHDPASFAPTDQHQPGFVDPSFTGGDFSLFPPNPARQDDQFDSSLFDQSLNPGDMSAMAMTQGQHSPTPPHLLNPEGHAPGSAHQSPSFNQHQFSSPPGGHSRHASLGPEAALLPNQFNEWSRPQFQGHRRSPSAHSDVSSAASPSPHLVSSDTFDDSHSPLQQPQDPALYSQIQGLDSFTISDPAQGSPSLQHSRSPSHSPAISPRVAPQVMPDINQPNNFGIDAQTGAYSQAEAFPSLQQQQPGQDMSQMAPAINIEFAPTAARGPFDMAKPMIDQDSLTPPERGRLRSRPRAVTDPFNSGGTGVIVGRPHSNSDSLSPHMAPNMGIRSDTSRSLSPLDRSTRSPSRRRQSTSAVPNNEMALRLADPEYQGQQDNGGPGKRAQKHPATFQCTLCPKRFTRAYNLRSHLRTHTDERPFVCTVCGKAFARQHDRKRHEGLHSGEKKFVCKGELKAGGQWGCGRRFARADALGRHFRSEAGRICIKPLLDEEMVERQRLMQEQHMQQNMAHNLAAPGMGLDANGYPMDPQWLPQALLTQYPALAGMQWSGPDASSGLEDDLSGRSSFDASDYEGDESGYVSTGTGFGDGTVNQNYGEMGYASDYGGR